MVETQSDHSTLSGPLNMLRRFLPLAMSVVLLAAGASVFRLSLSLGQPFPGFALMWRKEEKLFAVGHLTPLQYPGMVAGMEINDRILCLGGYHPHPEGAIYALDKRYNDIDCPNGEISFADLYRAQFTKSESPSIDILIDRGAGIQMVKEVPLVPFTIFMLVDALLPPLAVGLMLLGLAAVVFAAGSRKETNLVFATFALIVAAFFIGHGFSIIISDKWVFAPKMAILLAVPWMPLASAVLVHLVSIFPEREGREDRVTQWARAARGPYYALCFAFVCIGILSYIYKDQPIGILLDEPYLMFVAASMIFAMFWAILMLFQTSTRSSSVKTRRQSRLLLFGFTMMGLSMLPYGIYFFTSGTTGITAISLAPYLALGFVAVAAYAILRYQLFTSRTQVLTGLLVLIFSILIANIVYLVMRQQTSYVPIWVATLLASAGLVTRKGPTSFFTRLLRREALEYDRVVHFNQQVTGQTHVASLMKLSTQSFKDLLDADQVTVLLANADTHEFDLFQDGDPAGRLLLPADVVDFLRAHPQPHYANSPLMNKYHGQLSSVSPVAINVWIPLVEREQVVGMVGLGQRWMGELYDEQDLQLLAILGRQLAMTVLTSRHVDRLEATSRLILEAQEKERLKIARELHDTILQFLLVLTYGLDDLKSPQSDAAFEIERWQDRISVQADGLRGLLAYLRAPETLVQQGLEPALQTWLQGASAETSAQLTWHLSAEAAQGLDSKAQIAIYRVIREAVYNSIKHGQVSRIEVVLERVEDQICFSVEDDGRGFDLDRAQMGKEKGYSSLRDMRLYVESVGGVLKIDATPELGTNIKGGIPRSIESYHMNSP